MCKYLLLAHSRDITTIIFLSFLETRDRGKDILEVYVGLRICGTILWLLLSSHSHSQKVLPNIDLHPILLKLRHLIS